MQHTSLSIDKIYVVTCVFVMRERERRERERERKSLCVRARVIKR